MFLEADKVEASAGDDEDLASVWFRDATQDYVFSLSRFVGEEDDGTIEVMVRDQITHPTDAVTVVLGDGELHAELTEEDAAALDGVRAYRSGSTSLPTNDASSKPPSGRSSATWMG